MRDTVHARLNKAKELSRSYRDISSVNQIKRIKRRGFLIKDFEIQRTDKSGSEHSG